MIKLNLHLKLLQQSCNYNILHNKPYKQLNQQSEKYVTAIGKRQRNNRQQNQNISQQYVVSAHEIPRKYKNISQQYTDAIGKRQRNNRQPNISQQETYVSNKKQVLHKYKELGNRQNMEQCNEYRRCSIQESYIQAYVENMFDLYPNFKICTISQSIYKKLIENNYLDNSNTVCSYWESIFILWKEILFVNN